MILSSHLPMLNKREAVASCPALIDWIVEQSAVM
jgi:hypothetical protein